MSILHKREVSREYGLNKRDKQRQKRRNQWRIQTSKVRSDMVSLGAGGAAILPFARETEIVGAFPADVVVAEMVVKRFWVWGDF